MIIWKAHILSSNETIQFEAPSNFKSLNGDLYVKTKDDILIIDEFDLESLSQTKTKKNDPEILIEGYFDHI